jgi:hypothetical protein
LNHLHHNVAVAHRFTTPMPPVDKVSTVSHFPVIPISSPSSSTFSSPSSSSSSTHRVVYDLGLGKNPSLAELRRQNNLDSQTRSMDDFSSELPRSTQNSPSTMEITQHWLEYEAVHTFPFPSSKTLTVNLETTVPNDQLVKPAPSIPSKPSTKKSYPHLKPQRVVSDVLHIQSHPQMQDRSVKVASADEVGKESIPRTSHHIARRRASSTQGSSSKLDPNTIWVEMLLHDQLVQLQQQQLQQPQLNVAM